MHWVVRTVSGQEHVFLEEDTGQLVIRMSSEDVAALRTSIEEEKTLERKDRKKVNRAAFLTILITMTTEVALFIHGQAVIAWLPAWVTDKLGNDSVLVPVLLASVLIVCGYLGATRLFFRQLTRSMEPVQNRRAELLKTYGDYVWEDVQMLKNGVRTRDSFKYLILPKTAATG